MAVPIHHTAASRFTSLDVLDEIATGKRQGHVYSRVSNPTTDVLERRMAALEGGVGALAVASGHAAEVVALLTIMSAGDEFVAANSLYGGTFNLFKNTLPRLGINARFADANDPAQVAAAIDDRCKAVFVETIGNPALDVPDLEALAKVAHQAGVPLIVDNTAATPALLRPLELGADVVIESATKYIGGHGQAIGGVIIDGGEFPWDNGRFPEFTGPRDAFGGGSLLQAFGSLAFILKARLEMLRDLGPAISPFNSHSLLTGLETLSLRMERHCRNALAVATFLAGHPRVEWVRYPGLESDPAHPNASRFLAEGCGGLVTFGLGGGTGPARKLIDSLVLASRAASFGDTRTLVMHPASGSHRQLTPEQRHQAGVTDDLIRLSVGIEHVDDIIADLEQGLAVR